MCMGNTKKNMDIKENGEKQNTLIDISYTRG